jgi:hypothetical protein
VQAWKEDYPWLQLAFKSWGGGDWKAASEAWRTRIEEELGATLEFKERPDGTTTVWCGMSSRDFHHYPTPKELLEGLADCYRREVKRVRGGYPTQTRQWKMSGTAAARSGAPSDLQGTRRGRDECGARRVVTGSPRGSSAGDRPARK